MADATCIDCGADVFRNGPTGNPPSRCPACRKVRRREINRRADAKRLAADPDRNKRVSREFRQRNPGYVSPGHLTPEYRAAQAEYISEWKRAHPESVRSYTLKWRARNPDRYAAANLVRNRRRRARQAAAPTFMILPSEWRRMVARHRGRCAYCAGPGPLTQEHVIPITRGGSHGIGNLLPVCGPCNVSKHNLLFVEWRYSQRPGAARIAA